MKILATLLEKQKRKTIYKRCSMPAGGTVSTWSKRSRKDGIMRRGRNGMEGRSCNEAISDPHDETFEQTVNHGSLLWASSLYRIESYSGRQMF